MKIEFQVERLYMFVIDVFEFVPVEIEINTYAVYRICWKKTGVER